MSTVACIGGACVDRKYQVLFEARAGTSNPARARRSFGGVARNVAENLARLGVRTALFTAVGTDENGTALLQHATGAGIDARFAFRDSEHVTPEYAAIVGPAGTLEIGVSDMRAIDALDAARVRAFWESIPQPQWLFADCNMPAEVLAWCIRTARESSVKLAIDAVSEPKACRLPADLSGVDVLVLNEREAAAYLDDLGLPARTPAQLGAALRARGAASVLLTRGPLGLLAFADGAEEVPAVRARCVDETGAGDALIAGALYRLLEGGSLAEAARAGSLCAALTVESEGSVRPDLSRELLQRERGRLDLCAN